MKIPFDRLFHINVVVRNAADSAKKFARMYGIARWEATRYGPDRLAAATTHGFTAEHEFMIARGTAQTPVGDVTFHLIQPLSGWTTYQEFLLAKGEGIHSLCASRMAPRQFAELSSFLSKESIDIGQHHQIDGVLDRYQLDTRKALGGFYLEVEVATAPDAISGLRHDEIWNTSDSIPSGGPTLPLMPTDLSLHFGVVLFDLWATIRQWQRLVGIEKWTVYNWHTSPESLEDPTYMGKPVDHAYLSTLVEFNKLLAFELIQPTFGPSHYRENYRDQLGEGIHHVAASCLPSADAWQAAVSRLNAEGVPIVMSGGVGGGYADFYYLDTREALAGYVTEAIHPGRNRSSGAAKFETAMTLDLSRKAAP